jgi:hypothetical protein
MRFLVFLKLKVMLRRNLVEVGGFDNAAEKNAGVGKAKK